MLDQPAKPVASSPSVLEVLQRMHADTRFDGLLQSPGVTNTNTILKSQVARMAIAEHFNSIDFASQGGEGSMEKIHELSIAAVHLLYSAFEPSPLEEGRGHFDFYLTHQITFCWCLVVLVPKLPATATPTLLRAVWLLMVLTYVTQLLPRIVVVHAAPTTSSAGSAATEWSRLNDVALNAATGQGMDPHFVKVIRTLREFAALWLGDEMLFLHASIMFERGFGGWGGDK